MQILNDKLDALSSTSEGVITEYTRDSSGRILSESVRNSEGSGLYTRTTAYGTDSSGNPTVMATDEYGKTSVSTLDPVWGVVTSTSLPDGSLITYEYDDGKYAMTKRLVGGNPFRSNILTYADGYTSAVQTGNLTYGFAYNEGRLTSVTKNNASVEEHEYTIDSVSSYYPSKNTKSFEYVTNLDKYGRVTSQVGALSNEYDVLAVFDSDGTRTAFDNNHSALIVSSTDEAISEITRYEYDTANRIVAKRTTKKTTFSDKINSHLYGYDVKNRLTDYTCVYDAANAKNVKSSITYKKTATNPTADNTVLLYMYRVDNTIRSSTNNLFDDFKRIKAKTVTMGGGTFVKEFTYSGTRITGLQHKFGNYQNIGNAIYTYDALGRISSLTYTTDSTKSVSYEYDKYGQLVRENNQIYGYTYEYIYNNIGNITNVKTYSYTTPSATPTNLLSNKAYTYSTTYRDRLTSYNGNGISYNTYGYVSSYNGYNYSWSKGRLSGISKGNPRLTTGDYTATSFTYDGYGQRITKRYIFNSNTPTIGDALPTYNTTYKYDDLGRLVYEYCTETYKSTGAIHSHELVYLYDESGVIGVMYSYDGETAQAYYYQRNLQGDVIAILNGSGSKVAEYAYDAWGNCNIVSFANANLASYNPIRYRGYYYDRETRLYYLNARYYSPEWRRFISPDDTSYLDPESVNGLNLYAY